MAGLGEIMESWSATLARTLDLEELSGATESEKPRLQLIQRYVSFLLSVFCVFWGVEITTHVYVVFLTHWGCILTALYFTLVLTAYGYPKVGPVAYVLYETTTVLETLICLLFWLTVYPFVDLHVIFIYTLSVHAGLLLLLLLDYPFNRIRFRLRHFWMSILVLALYLVMYVPVAFLIRPIYPFVTFTDVGTVVVLAVAFLMVFGGHWLGVKADQYKYRNTTVAQRFELGPILKS